ncbi:MAG: PaaI family thioesterase [Burkholderiales bacterium]|nr:PaaI family thioesterase [Burkholderiales bacterium]
MSDFKPRLSAEQFNTRNLGHLSHTLGIRFVSMDGDGARAELPVATSVMAPNGFLHAGAVVSLADSACGLGCVAHLPEGASGFTTIELKSNHLGTAREGVVEVLARPVHLGRTTQVWDATVTHRETGKTIALFRCTQMILWPK